MLSAYGMGLADQTAMREAAVERRLDAAGLAKAEAALEALASQAREELARQGVETERIVLLRRLHLRYEGTDTALPLACAPGTGEAELRAGFDAAYRQRFAFLMPDRALVIEAASVEAVGAGASSAAPSRWSGYASTRRGPTAAASAGTRPLCTGASGWRRAPSSTDRR